LEGARKHNCVAASFQKATASETQGTGDSRHVIESVQVLHGSVTLNTDGTSTHDHGFSRRPGTPDAQHNILSVCALACIHGYQPIPVQARRSWFVINRKIHKKSIDVWSDDESPINLPQYANFLFLLVDVDGLLEERRLCCSRYLKKRR